MMTTGKIDVVTIGAFLRIATHPRVYDRPLTGTDAAQFVSDWLATPPVWIPPASAATFRIYRDLCDANEVSGNLVPDAMLAALAIEHGLIVMTADTDLNRFDEAASHNPLA